MAQSTPPVTAPRATAFAAAPILAAVLAAMLAPDVAADVEILLWLLAVTPAFLLAYYRGWRDIALAMAAVMVALVAVQLGTELAGGWNARATLLVRVLLVAAGTSIGIITLAGRLYHSRSLIQRLELSDPLTGLPNRRYANIVLEREFAAALRGRPLNLVIFDVDGHREYRARNGEDAWAKALTAFGRALYRATRRMNLSARWDQGRFVSILSSGGAEGAAVFAHRVQTGLARSGAAVGGFSVSAGIACYQPGMNSLEELMRAADLALYHAQQAGPGSVQVYEAPDQTAGLQESLRQFRSMLGESGQLGYSGA